MPELEASSTGDVVSIHLTQARNSSKLCGQTNHETLTCKVAVDAAERFEAAVVKHEFFSTVVLTLCSLPGVAEDHSEHLPGFSQKLTANKTREVREYNVGTYTMMQHGPL